MLLQVLALIAAVVPPATGLSSATDWRLTIDSFFTAVSLGEVDTIIDLFTEDASAMFPPFPQLGFMGGQVRGREALRSFWTDLIGAFSVRHARATNIIVEGNFASSALRFEAVTTAEEPVVMDNLNLWTFSEGGLVKDVRVYSGVVPNEPRAERSVVALPDPARDGQLVRAVVCLPPRAQESSEEEPAPAPLLIFAHGWRLAAEDYDYLCDELTVPPDGEEEGEQPWAVAIIQSDGLEDPTVNPAPLTPLAADAAFLSHALLSDESLAGRLSGEVVLGGHSLGGGATVYAATELGAKVDALVLWAPGLYGVPDADASLVAAPTLVMLGASDCVNVPDGDLTGIDTYAKLSTERKALAIIKDANHCAWSSVVTGDCDYDVCNEVPRLALQAAGLLLFRSFASAALDGGVASWHAFEDVLDTRGSGGAATDVEWQPFAGCNVSNVEYPLCPPTCCSDALAEMGMCSV